MIINSVSKELIPVYSQQPPEGVWSSIPYFTDHLSEVATAPTKVKENWVTGRPDLRPVAYHMWDGQLLNQEASVLVTYRGLNNMVDIW